MPSHSLLSYHILLGIVRTKSYSVKEEIVKMLESLVIEGSKVFTA